MQGLEVENRPHQEFHPPTPVTITENIGKAQKTQENLLATNAETRAKGRITPHQ
jgi:hypothetical protein